MAKHRNVRNARLIRNNMFVKLRDIKKDMLVKHINRGWYFYLTTDGALKTDCGLGKSEVVVNAIGHYDGSNGEYHNHWLDNKQDNMCVVVTNALIVTDTSF